MIHALTERATRHAEERAESEQDLSMAELMRRAGRAVADEVELRVPYGSVAVIAGKGNNGGDGWVVARRLHLADRLVHVYTPQPPEDLEGVAGEAAREAIAAGVHFSVDSASVEMGLLEGHAVVVDAVFGVGFSGPVREPYDSWLDAINASGATVLSVDMPSGVETDSGHVAEHAVRADVTVTFSAPKVGLLLYPGATHAGEVVVADIGVPRHLQGADGDLELWERGDYAALLPPLSADTHKNIQGRVLIVGGSGSFPGAAALAAMGAQRMGAGYVTLAVPESIAPVIQSKLSSAVVIALAENPSHTLASKVTDEILDIAREYDSVVIGPGLTVAHGAVLVARKLVRELPKPLVVDADGLNALVDASDALMHRAYPTVITPHPGELARMLDVTPADIQADRLSYGGRLSGERSACVLKGAHTVISGRGRQVLNTSGGPALATAGTGDVLAGMVGALLAQGLEPLEAGALGAHLHGRAGDLAANDLSERCVIAEDVPAYLPKAVRELLGTE